MSARGKRSPLARLLDALDGWGFDIERRGRSYTASLLGEPHFTFHADDSNADLRAVLQRAGEMTGHRVDLGAGKRARAHRHVQAERERQTTQTRVVDYDRQIRRVHQREQLIRDVTNRENEIRDFERLMGAR